MVRIRVNLKSLPLWLQYFLALIVTALVVTLAWFSGRDRPHPAWITDYLIPIWQWVGTGILFVFIGAWLLKKIKK